MPSEIKQAIRNAETTSKKEKQISQFTGALRNTSITQKADNYWALSEVADQMITNVLVKKEEG